MINQVFDSSGSGKIGGTAQVLPTPTPPLTARTYQGGQRAMPIVQIPLSQSKFALIDEQDADRVLAHRWYAGLSGTCWYARTKVKGKTIYLHRLIMQPPTSRVFVDHIDGDGLNCTRANMRLVTPSQNLMNRTRARRDGSSGYIGVTWDKIHVCWVADVGLNGKRVRVGCFSSAREAAIARDKVAKEMFGEFAGLNFPDMFEGIAS